jgi:hypothetical protein
MRKDHSNILSVPNLLCCWDFGCNNPFISKGKFNYELIAGKEKPAINNFGVLSDGSISIMEGQYLFVPRKLCPALNISGKNAAVTILAWIKRKQKSYSQCEAVAGMWNETRKKRQYCLFLNLQLFNSGDQVCGHISGVGGPTPGQKWCIDASIGSEKVPYNKWSFVGFSYDGQEIKSYLNGQPDLRDGHNPYEYPEGIFDAGDPGADFTVGAVDRLGEMGNFFVGDISGLAIFDRALTESEIKRIHKDFPLPDSSNKAHPGMGI